MGGGPKLTVSGDLHPKTELNSGLPLLLGRPVTKDDTVYEVDDSNGKFVAVISIPELGRTCKGKAADSKKEAEANAAKSMFNQLKKQIHEIRPPTAGAKTM